MRVEIRVHRAVVPIVILGVLLFALGVAPVLQENPFLVARQALIEAGDWSEEDVHFLGGEYWILLIECRVEARAMVSTPEGPRRAEIRMVHRPFVGWSVRDFHLDEPDAAVRARRS